MQPISSVTANIAPAAVAAAPLPQVVSNTSIPTVAAPATATRLPGYYVLESAIRGLSEQPRYVYWGPEPPSAANLK
jgi:phosphoribosylcarboxyaminoimidazole (NCAIR) mutase